MAYFIAFDRQSHPLGPGVLVIGSGSEAGLRIRGYDLAPVHALVTHERDGRVILARAFPELPVRVNGRFFEGESVSLALGDVVQLGGAELTLTDSPVERPAASEEGYLRDLRREQLYALGERTVIGRDRPSDILLHEPTVTRAHAEIRFTNGTFLLVPTGPTSLNGNRIGEPVRLQDGDEIDIGRTTLRFSTSVPTNSMIEDSRRTRQERRARPRTPVVLQETRPSRRWRTVKRVVGRTAVAVIAMALVIAAVLTFFEGRETLSPAAAGDFTPPAVAAPATPTTP